MYVLSTESLNSVGLASKIVILIIIIIECCKLPNLFIGKILTPHISFLIKFHGHLNIQHLKLRGVEFCFNKSRINFALN